MGDLAETWVCLGFDTFESLKSKHENAREVGTFKAARVAAQDCRKSPLPIFVKTRPQDEVNISLHLPSTPKYARAPASDPSP